MASRLPRRRPGGCRRGAARVPVSGAVAHNGLASGAVTPRSQTETRRAGRGGCASMCVGQGANISYQDLSTFCAKGIAGIGKLPDTVADRFISIRLKRARRGSVERFRERDVTREAGEIQAKIATWASTNLETLKRVRPTIPGALSDRQADCCEPLLAIADLAGGDWPDAARAALVKLCADAQASDDSIGVRLLSDIRNVLCPRDEHGKPLPEREEMPSTELAEALAKIETSPWAEWNMGKPLSPVKLARLLKPFDVFPCQVQNGVARGYRLADFREPLSLYLPAEYVKVSETRENSGENGILKMSEENAPDTLKNVVSSTIHAPSRHFDTLKPETGEREQAENSAKAAQSDDWAKADENSVSHAKRHLQEVLEKPECVGPAHGVRLHRPARRRKAEGARSEPPRR